MTQDPVSAMVSIFDGLTAPKVIDGCETCRQHENHERTARDRYDGTAATDTRIRWRHHLAAVHNA